MPPPDEIEFEFNLPFGSGGLGFGADFQQFLDLVRSRVPPEGIRFEPPLLSPPLVAAGAALALPQPTPPVAPTPSVRLVPSVRLPTGPAANDPIFRPRGVLPGIIGRASVVVSGALIIRDIIEMIEEQQSIEFGREIREDVRIRRRQIARQRDFLRDVRVSPPLEIPPIEEIELFPEVDIPSPPVRAPEPQFEPFPIEIPAQPAALPAPIVTPSIPTPTLPAPVPAPTPTAPPATPAPSGPTPRPGPLPGPFPLPVPGTPPSTLPGFFPVFAPRRFFVGRPSTFAPGLPAGSPVADLTPVRDDVQQSQIGSIELPQPQPQPELDTAKKCKNVKRRRRRKGKCKEGFFREFAGSTQFTDWREVDCATREETQKSKLGNRGFDLTDVEFPDFGG